MKHIFIINPVTVTQAQKDDLIKNIYSACKELHVEDFEVYFSPKPGGAAEYAKQALAKYPDDKIRFYSCGGDGTLGNLTEGVYGFEKAELGAVPVGTGNDFIRNFGNKEQFMNIKAQMTGHTTKVDVIDFNGHISMNMLNIGFDCQVVGEVNRLRGTASMPKSMAYTMGVIRILVKMPYTPMEIEFADGMKISGKRLLTLVGNGCYCGGGFKAASLASVKDGKLDILSVEPVGRLKFVSLVGDYKKGTLVGSKKANGVVTYRQSESVIIRFSEETDVCYDGEVMKCKELNVKVVPKAIDFVIPNGINL